MAELPDQSFTHDHVVGEDGSVSFSCSRDVEEWPWLALEPLHPILIQTENFWTSVGASRALGTREEGKWSALTWTDWTCGEPDVGHAVRGVFERTEVDDQLAFATRLFDADDREVVHMRGKGVVFRTRNFESWRESSKRKAAVSDAPEDFEYASQEALGLPADEPPLLSPLDKQGGLHAEALITRDNGLMPGHPYFSGSGDHVNTPHLAEIGRQFISLLLGGAPFTVTEGEMDMHRYVELGCPFRVDLRDRTDGEVKLSISQLGRDCASMRLRYRAG